MSTERLMNWINLILLGGVIYFVYRFFSKTDTQKKKNQEIEDITIDYSNLKYTEQELISKADQLFNFMDRVGSDEDSFISVLKTLKTIDDLKYIVKYFGLRPYMLGMEAHITSIAAPELNLIGWIREEFSGDDLKSIKAEFDRLKFFVL